MKQLLPRKGPAPYIHLCSMAGGWPGPYTMMFDPWPHGLFKYARA